MKFATVALFAFLAAGGALPARAVETAQTQISGAQSAQTLSDLTARSNAAQWGLNLDEYRRYEALMKGMRGSISDPRITPIEVLGIHARSEAERQKYAEIFARLMAEDTERVLQFQLAYQANFKRLFPNLPAIYVDPASNRPPSLKQVLDTAPLLPTTVTPPKGGVVATSTQQPAKVASFIKPIAVMKGDRLIVFTGSNCVMCDAVVNQAKGHTHKGVTVDVYVVGAKTADDVASYANRIRVEPQLVRTGALTLNLDKGTMARVLPGEKSLPQVVRKRGELVTALGADEL
jgi:hypothetical protein